MADDQYMAENGAVNNAQYYQQVPQRNVVMNRPGLQNEPSVSIVRDDIQRPLSTLQQNLIQGNLQEPSNINMRDFINELEDYVPTIPDAVTMHFMRSCGCDCSDPRIVRLVALATQKYVSDIILDAM
ncbi:transcription initiation factor TFIID subunit, partial [Oesophagostomum dentatum]